MSRPLKVPREQALEAAMYVFWTKGYHQTSIDDLQSAMGFQRGSFYFHFKDKRSLFIEVLENYRVTVVEKRRSLVRATPSAKSGIYLYFDILLEHLLSHRANSGCLNTNSATELGLSDKEIADKLGLGLEDWKHFWIEILEKAKQQNEIPQELDVVAVAQLLVGLTQGLNVVARVNPDPLFLKGIIKSGLTVLD